jgi:Xylose isomerase-like TIM barrel
MNNLGFSTGALAKGDFRSALRTMKGKALSAVELSALRSSELPELLEASHTLDLSQFTYVSMHAPTLFVGDEESQIAESLQVVPKNWKIVIHPDTIKDASLWRGFGNQLLLENMDRRKSDGRTAEELSRWFEILPGAQLCVDLAHAQQWDTTMTEAYVILKKFHERVCQIHISELDSTGRHFPLSKSSIDAFSQIASLIPKDAAVIIESRVDAESMDREMAKARDAIEGTHAPGHAVALTATNA